MYHAVVISLLALGASAALLLSAGCATSYAPRLAAGHEPTPATLPAELRATITTLAVAIGERNCYHPAQLEQAASYLESQLRGMGYTVRRLPFDVPGGEPYRCAPQTVYNLEVEKLGTTRPEEVIIFGAHYDSKVATPGWHDHGPPLPAMAGTPGANDNGSGVAATLALARLFATVPTARTLRFVCFVNEEPPFFQTPAMGSRVYAQLCAAEPAKQVVGMITPDTIGCYSIRNQRKRVGVASLAGLPSRPDYVAFMSNRGSRPFVRQCATIMQQHSPLAVRTIALPAVSEKVAWSDDWSFWQEGIPAFLVTDTAFLRHDDYHERTDLPELLDYRPMADVVWGLYHVLSALANPPPGP